MKSGDRVICIKDKYSSNILSDFSGDITLGKVYDIIITTSNYKIMIKNDYNFLFYYPMSLFKNISEYRDDLINKICK